MILLAIGVFALVIAAAVAVVLSMRAAAHANAAADEVRATVDQLVDALAEVFLDDEEADERRGTRLLQAIDALQAHQSAMDDMAEQQRALRKQMKHILTQASQTNETAKRYLMRQRNDLAEVEALSALVKRHEQEEHLNG